MRTAETMIICLRYALVFALMTCTAVNLVSSHPRILWHLLDENADEALPFFPPSLHRQTLGRERGLVVAHQNRSGQTTEAVATGRFTE